MWNQESYDPRSYERKAITYIEAWEIKDFNWIFQASLYVIA